MIQISYQPAYDPYHTSLRMLRLVSYGKSRIFRIGEIRIADFFILFPHFLNEVRLAPGAQAKARKLGLLSPPAIYGEIPKPTVIFLHMEGIQQAALQTLCLQGFFDRDSFLEGRIRAGQRNLPDELRFFITEKNSQDAVLLTFLFDNLLSFDFDGPDGIKARTGLMEYRYDAVL